MVTLADGKYSGDASTAKQSVTGDLLCLLSAIIYGAYTVSIRRAPAASETGRGQAHNAAVPVVLGRFATLSAASPPADAALRCALSTIALLKCGAR